LLVAAVTECNLAAGQRWIYTVFGK